MNLLNIRSKIISILGIAFIIAIVFNQIHLPTKLQIILTFFMLILAPGYLFWGMLFHTSVNLERLILGAGAALVLLAFGGFLSKVFENFEIRYIPTLLVYMIFAFYKNKFSQNKSNSNIPILVGSSVGFLVMVKQLVTTLNTQPFYWRGNWKFDVDTIHNISITSEITERIPELTPHALFIPLNYTWMFHSFLGVFASASDISAQYAMLQIWPILFTLLIPASISVISWKLTSNSWTAILAPAVYGLFNGPTVLYKTWMSFFAAVPSSPTHEINLIFTLIVIGFISNFLNISSLNIKLFPIYLSIFFVLIFVSAGAKGNAGLSYFGFFAVLGIASLFFKYKFKQIFTLAITAGLAIIFAQFFIVKSSSYTTIGPFSFIEPTANPKTAQIATATLVIWTMFIFAFIALKNSSIKYLELATFGIFAFGVFGMTFFDHPGKSQAYFYWGAIPILSIYIANIFVWAIQSFKLRALIVVALAISCSKIFTPTYANEHEIDFISWVFWSPLIIGILVTAFFYLSSKFMLKTKLNKLSLVSIFSLFLVFNSVFTIQDKSWAGVSAEVNGRTISKSQLDAYAFLKENSNPYDVVLTNNHCFGGTKEANTCDERQFSLSAFSGRRVYYESTYYPFGTSDDNRAIFKKYLALNDEFLANPNIGQFQTLKSLDAKWVYIFKDVSISPNLNQYAQLVFENESSQIWKLQ